MSQYENTFINHVCWIFRNSIAAIPRQNDYVRKVTGLLPGQYINRNSTLPKSTSGEFPVYVKSSWFCSYRAHFTPLHFLTIKTPLKRYSVNFYIFIWYPKFSIIPFHNNNRLFKSNSAFLKLPHTSHFVTQFLIKKPLKNRYTRKQPAYFSITPLRSKFKKIANRKIWYAWKTQNFKNSS